MDDTGNNQNTGIQSDHSVELDKINKELFAKNRELEESNARNSTVLESIGDGVVVVDTNGDISYCNKQIELMTGWPSADLLGKRLVQVLKLVDSRDIEIPLDKVPIRNALFANKKVQNNEFFYLRRDGTKFAAAITANPIHIGDNVIGGVNTVRDVTREREVDRMKTEFISLASHQLRTPLSAMKWFSELLLTEEVGTLTDEQKDLINQIYQSNERMIELVNSLLNISRIESGRIIIEPVATNLKKLIDEVVTDVTKKLKEKEHNLVISVNDTLPEVLLDPKLVRHVYMNLLTNAIKYTDKGGEIQVIVSRQGDEIISQISDNGYGIPSNAQQKIFSKFFRAENISKVETDGTGLGLYLTKAVVESSGGKIWFGSEEGKGTTFWFSLPLEGVPAKEGEVSIDS